jgi:peptidyl-tRNA hydrolase
LLSKSTLYLLIEHLCSKSPILIGSDIEATLKTKEYARLRVGISGPGRKPLAEHVLGEFNANETDSISAAVTQCSRIIEDWITVDEMQLVMNRCNGQTTSK